MVMIYSYNHTMLWFSMLRAGSCNSHSKPMAQTISHKDINKHVDIWLRWVHQCFYHLHVFISRLDLFQIVQFLYDSFPLVTTKLKKQVMAQKFYKWLKILHALSLCNLLYNIGHRNSDSDSVSVITSNLRMYIPLIKVNRRSIMYCSWQVFPHIQDNSNFSFQLYSNCFLFGGVFQQNQNIQYYSVMSLNAHIFIQFHYRWQVYTKFAKSSLFLDIFMSLVKVCIN